MSISNNSKRIQLTFNEDKEKERVVLDYLANSFNETQEIKRILYEYIVNQSGVKRVNETKSEKKSIKGNNVEPKSLRTTRSKAKVVKDSKSDNKLLTNSDSDLKIVKDNGNTSKVITNSGSEDFELNLSNFKDELVEAKPSSNGAELEQIKRNELQELSKFM
ncbi:hypothetical protein [Clostridium sp. CF012]|uniref:hypothetical protein n=1 Tax=Clostridium sp. CF012 TaxID=2843319 RepID=UPI001C0D1D9F|nr:hypothetical protein [Clostridium sp. CF012]MBU3142236.1 hypothetical protein [Clostridium sp. CF012]